MNFKNGTLLSLWTGALLAAGAPAMARPFLPLIPFPAQASATPGEVTIGDGATIAVPAADPGTANAARLLAERVRVVRGLALRAGGPGPATIRFVRDGSVQGNEAYRLIVAGDGVTIRASGDSGLLYGAMTLAQLLSPDGRFGAAVRLAGVAIEDRPAYRWRGYMADVARHFQPIAGLRSTIDEMAALKLNVLHLHLSDDQGWRVEIKRYPDLTRIGAWRMAPGSGGVPGARYGGFYTQDELRDLVAYAAERGITIVPEIDLPGHSQALVASYPELGVFGDRPAVSTDWGINPYLLNPSPQGVTFVENILDELMAIFPSPYIHLGGDEAIKDQWQRSPAVQAQMAARGLKTEDALQGALIRTFDGYLRAHGRRLIGWDEILDGGDLPPSAVVMSWRGGKGGIVASAAGHDVILSPAPLLYLDNLQSTLPDEPPGRLSNPPQSLALVYAYDPMPQEIVPENRAHVLGAQMNAWAEYLNNTALVQHATFPRLTAFAEVMWSAPAQRDFSGFLDRLEPQMARFSRVGVPAADSAFAVAYALEGSRGAALAQGRARLRLANQATHGQIRYTLDGSEPTIRSRLYLNPLDVALGTIVKATAFGRQGQALAAPRAFDTSRTALLRAGPSDMLPCPGENQQVRVPLTSDSTDPAPAFNINLFDSCFLFPAAPLAAARAITVEVARLPRNVALAGDFDRIRQHFAATRFGELIVRTGSCQGAVAATFPLPDPAQAPNRLRFAGGLPPGAQDSDLCLLFTASIEGVTYAIAGVELSGNAL